MKTVYIYDPTAADEQSKVRGIGRYFQTLTEALANSQTDGSKKTVESFSPYQIHTQEEMSLYSKFTADLKLVKKNGIFVNPFFNPIQKPLTTKPIAKKQIAVIHDLIPQKYPKHFPIGLKGRWYKFLNKRALKKYDIIITDSLVSKKDIMKIYDIPKERVQVIYPTVPHIFTPHLDTQEETSTHHHPFHKEQDHSVPEFTHLSLEEVSNNPQIQQLQNFILYVGDATWNKNLANLAQSIKMANIPCVFVGKVFGNAHATKLSDKPHPWQKSLQQFLKMAENDKRFIFPGYVSDIELLLLYKKAKINILVSEDEGFGLSFIEAGYMSTPSILSDVPIFHETAREAALFANPHDPKEIAQTISRLFYDSVLNSKMSIRAFDRAQDFSPQKFQKQWTELLKML